MIYLSFVTDNIILALFGVAIAFTLIGIRYKLGVFNLLSIPIWVVLGLEFIAFAPLLAVTFVGAVIFEFYYAFWGLN